LQTARLAQSFKPLNSSLTAFNTRVTLAQSHMRSGCYGAKYWKHTGQDRAKTETSFVSCSGCNNKLA